MRSPRPFLALLISVLFALAFAAAFGHQRAESNANGFDALGGGGSSHQTSISNSDEASIAEADSLADEVKIPSPTPTSTLIPTLTPTNTPSATPTPSSTPTFTPIPTSTPTQTPSPTPSQTPLPTQTPQYLNGVSSHDFIVMDEDTRQHIRDIYLGGQVKGRDPQRLSRIGASIIDTDQFLVRFGRGDYDLGPYSHLQPVVDYFNGSLERSGVGIRRGLTAWMVLDPTRSDKSQCEQEESMLACEIRLNNPSVLLLVLGTNDIGEPERFEESMRQIIEYSLDQSVIPVLTTKADRYEGSDNRNNNMLWSFADEYDIPLWDFDIVAETLPGKGLAKDRVHLTFLDDFDFNNPEVLERGYGLYNLSALMMLDEVWSEMKSTAFGYPTSPRQS